jgi:hypothetical protein
MRANVSATSLKNRPKSPKAYSRFMTGQQTAPFPLRLQIKFNLKPTIILLK